MPTQCKSCNATFDAIDARSGAAYFHACAPIANPAYQPDPLKGALNLQATIERPNKRDENVKLLPDGKTIVPISVGLGTQIV